MPPRRSSRAASAKPPSKSTQPSAENVAPRSRTKRAASPDRSLSPAVKRLRTENGAPPSATAMKPPSRAKSVPVSKRGRSVSKQPEDMRRLLSKRGRAVPVMEVVAEEDHQEPVAKRPVVEAKKRVVVPQQKPYFNPLPRPPAKQRPGLLLFAWGAGNFGQFGMGPDILDERDRPKKNEWVETGVSEGRFGKEGAALESIAAGGLHSVFIDERGTVWTCGVNDAAALGRETTDIPDPDNPGSFLDIDDLTSYPHPLQSLVDEDFRAVQVVAGDSINAAISAEGELRVWGSFRAKEGSLGFSTSQEYQFKPTPVNLDLIHKSGDYEKISSIACGGNHIMALTTHGHIFTWGTGEQGQLGRKVFDSHKLDGTTPRKIVLGTRRRKATVVGAGSFHSLAVDEAGEVWGWGLNTMGQLGNGTVTEIVEMPERVPALSKHALGGHTIVKIAGGEHHTLFLTSDGKVYSCGRSNGGQLGLADDHPAFKDREDPNYLAEPTLVSMPDQDDPAVQISCGVHNCLVITESGAMYAWGQGLQGELGVPDEVVKTPRVIVRREGGQWSAVDVSCGGQHTMGLFRKKTN